MRFWNLAVASKRRLPSNVPVDMRSVLLCGWVCVGCVCVWVCMCLCVGVYVYVCMCGWVCVMRYGVFVSLACVVILLFFFILVLRQYSNGHIDGWKGGCEWFQSGFFLYLVCFFLLLWFLFRFSFFFCFCVFVHTTEGGVCRRPSLPAEGMCCKSNTGVKSIFAARLSPTSIIIDPSIQFEQCVCKCVCIFQVLINVRNNRKLLGRIKAFDRHCNMVSCVFEKHYFTFL